MGFHSVQSGRTYHQNCLPLSKSRSGRKTPELDKNTGNFHDFFFLQGSGLGLVSPFQECAESWTGFIFNLFWTYDIVCLVNVRIWGNNQCTMKTFGPHALFLQKPVQILTKLKNIYHIAFKKKKICFAKQFQLQKIISNIPLI